MNEFVDECKREWRRLGVQRSTAEEMAAELTADLDEGTPEEVLGSDAVDAPSFARAWATERGVIGPRRRSRIPAVLAALALIPTIVGAVLVLATDDHVKAAAPPPGEAMVFVAPSPNEQRIVLQTMRARIVAQEAHAQVVARVVSAEPDDDSNTVGPVLLIVGLALLVPSTLLWSGRVALGR